MPVESLQTLQSILADYVCAENSPAGGQENGAAPRPCEIIVSYERQGVRGKIVLGRQWRVSLHDDLLHKLREQYGNSRIALNY